MNIGMNLFLWTNHAGPEHFPLFSTLAETGFDLIELPNSDYSNHEIKAINHELDKLQLNRTLATILDGSCNPISAQAGIRQAALNKLKRDIDLASALGAEALIGPIHSAHKLFTGVGPTADELKYCVDVLHCAGEYAAEADIDLCVEFLHRFECYLLNTSAQARVLIDCIGLPNVGILYDTHHAQIEECHQATAIKKQLAAINHIHISESHRGTPGTGTVAWPEVFASLREGQYNGRVVIEAFGTSVPAIAAAVNLWRDNFTDEREVYEKGYALIREGLRGT